MQTLYNNVPQNQNQDEQAQPLIVSQASKKGDVEQAGRAKTENDGPSQAMTLTGSTPASDPSAPTIAFISDQPKLSTTSTTASEPASASNIERATNLSSSIHHPPPAIKRFSSATISKQFLHKATSRAGSRLDSTSQHSKRAPSNSALSGNPRPAQPTPTLAMVKARLTTNGPSSASSLGWNTPRPNPPVNTANRSLAQTPGVLVPSSNRSVLAVASDNPSSEQSNSAMRSVKPWEDVKKGAAGTTVVNVANDFSTAVEVARKSQASKPQKQTPPQLTTDAASKALLNDSEDAFRGVHLDPNARHWDDVSPVDNDVLKPAEPEPLEFRGRDAEECEKFINAVSRQALAVGKQRDDQWTADFAASCFTDGALRWWDGLDEQIQCSWKLLRKAMLGRYRPLFYGRSGSEAEEFVHMIHERALDVGKQQDNEWIAAFTASSFVGDALRWYVTLDSGAQNDWKRLRRAILTQYPRAGAGITSFITIPTPAPAAPPPAPPTIIRQRGRIRVISTARPTSYYVSKIPDGAGFIVLTDNSSEVLQVDYNPSSTDRQTLHIPNDQIPGFDLLEMMWYPANSTKMTILCAINSKSGQKSLREYEGTLLREPWQISHRASLSDVGGTGLLALSATSGKAELYAQSHGSGSASWFDTERPTSSPVAFFLEPT